jgi:DNA polymerase bacteriophage-type
MTVRPAGLGQSTDIATFDFESYSEAGYVWDDAANRWKCLPGASQGRKGIVVTGAARYAEHPTCEALALAYDLLYQPPRLWRPGDSLPTDLFDYLARGGLIEAWNASFECWIWSKVCEVRYGFPPLPVEQVRCAMAKARAHALPGALDNAARVSGAATLKDADGKRLLNKFSVPRNPTKADPRRRILPADDPVDAAKLYAYNVQDLAAEAAVSHLVPDLSPTELEYWQIDQRINRRGVQIDTEARDNCIAIVEQAITRYDAELRALTGGAVEAASQLERLKGWLAGQGVHVGSLDEDHMEDALASAAPGSPARRALEIRALIGSASVKKLFAMRNQATAAGRLHDLFSYHGARTGRTTGNGPQPTNLPKAGPDVRQCGCGRWYGGVKSACPWCGVTAYAPAGPWSWEAVEDALSVIATRSLDAVEYVFGHALETVSGCLRGLFIAAPGCELICSDYSAIEAVGAAELAGEAWRQEVFRTHGMIYEMSASKMTGIPFEEYVRVKQETGKHHPTRSSHGKVGELASAYQGWIGAWKAFGADKFFPNEDAMKDAILAWRAESPAIVEMWGGQFRGRGSWRRQELYGLEGMAIAAILKPGEWFGYRDIWYVVHNDALYCRLPSGRHLTYHSPRLGPSDRGGYAITYSGWNSNPQMGPMGWVSLSTWGGRLYENVVQAVARDVQWHAFPALERAGYPLVLHVYDEDVAEVPIGRGSIEEFEAIMSTMPSWASGWPIRAKGGWRARRYRKD